jgi:tetratricopeptide (TPR) repeat protein
MSAKINSIRGAIILLALALIISGCTPAGPRALLKGRQLLDRGDYAGAVAQFKAATEILSTNAAAWNYYGVALQSAGQPDDAVNAYQRALDLDRDLLEARLNLGTLFLAQNKADAAKTEFIAYTLRRPNDAAGWLKLGAAQLKLGEIVPAERSFSAVLALKTSDAEAYNGLGLARIQRGKPRDAAQFFTAAVQARPDYAAAILNLATVNQQYLRDYKAALDNYRNYLALTPRPTRWDEVNIVANNLEQSLSAPPAPQLVTTPAATAPAPPLEVPMPEPTPKPSLWHRMFGGSADNPAAQTVPKGVTPLPGETIAPTVAAAPEKPAPVNIPPAPVDFPRYNYLSPRRPQAGDRRAASGAFTQAREAEQNEKWTDALNDYRSATALDPAWFEAQYNAGVIAHRLRNYDSALASYENALALQPDSVDARYNFALALKAAGYVPDAADELKKILAANPGEVRAHLALANLCAQSLHDPAQARRHYLKVLELDPKNPQATDIRFWLAANPG